MSKSRRPRRSLGDAVRAAREAKGLTQAALADAADVHRTTLVRIEQGQMMPTIEVLTRIADVLRVSLDHLVGR
jgi:transcriptional regulator with XRE-family HTH domain